MGEASEIEKLKEQSIKAGKAGGKGATHIEGLASDSETAVKADRGDHGDEAHGMLEKAEEMAKKVTKEVKKEAAQVKKAVGM